MANNKLVQLRVRFNVAEATFSGVPLVAFVDAEDAGLLRSGDWALRKKPYLKVSRLEPHTWPGRQPWYRPLHRLLVDSRREWSVRAINGNYLDCRRSNLQILPDSSAELPGRGSGLGVTWDASAGLWVAVVWAEDRREIVGSYDTAAQAVAAYSGALAFLAAVSGKND